MPSTRHAIMMSCVILALFMAIRRPQHALILDQSRRLAGSSYLLMHSPADGEQSSVERTSRAGKEAGSIEPEFRSSYTKPIAPNCTVAGFWHVSLVYPAVFSHWPYKEDGTKNPEAYRELERMAANHSDIYDLPWAHIVQEQLDAIRATDILDTSDGGVHVTYVGRKDMLDFARHKAEPRLAFHYGGDDPYVWEYPSLIRLQEHCEKHPDNYVWYIHSKGARYDPNGTGPEDHKAPGVAIWRRMMHHYVLTRHHDCLDAMAHKGFSACGGEYRQQHFPGNFWWARCDHINTLPRISLSTPWLADRMKAEKWVCGTPDNRGCKARSCISPKPKNFDSYHKYREEDFVNRTCS